MSRLQDKIALITGAARGTGEAMARLFVEEGAQVVLGDILDKLGEDVAKLLGPSARYVHLDVSQESDWAKAIEASAEFGSLNVLVNNAAIQSFGAITDTSIEDFMKVISVNQLGTFLGIRAAIEPMKLAGGGSIINVSSIDGLQAKNGLIAYVASKWAVRGMTKAAALELGHHGIRVNSIHPGGIDTLMGNPTQTDKIDEFYKRNPIARAGKPIEIARMALFLASDESSYSTGAEFLADGGWAAGDVMPFLPRS